MNRQAIAQPQAKSAPPKGPVLQRKCACGQHAGGGECEECRKKKQRLQRYVQGPAKLSEAPSSVLDVLRAPGQPLEPETRRSLEPHFGHDLSRVRLHADAQAAESAQEAQATAYTVGRDIVFGAGQYAPRTEAGRRLLAHELTHVVQQSRSTGEEGKPVVFDDPAQEQEAERHAREASLAFAEPTSAPSAGPVVQRQPDPGWDPGWAERAKGGPLKFVSGLNASEAKIGKIRRIPVDFLKAGNQEEEKPPAIGTKESAAGRAIVLLHEAFDSTQPAQVLLHFHGHNTGYRKTAGKYRDRDVDKIESQIEASNKPQLIGVLPQGTNESSFGKAGNDKAFDTDAYLGEVFGVLAFMGIWIRPPKVAGVTISGHSGAGELINEKLLAGAPGSALPSKTGPLREVALFDAVNGPRELLALQQFLQSKLDADLAELKARATQQDKLDYLKTSLRFRAYFSTGYSQWFTGPLPAKPMLKGQKPLKPFLDDWFTQHQQALGGTQSPVFQGLRQSYAIIAVGHGQHDLIMAQGDQLKDALSVLPKRSDGSRRPSVPDEAPSEVHEALRTQGRPLDATVRAWAEPRFGRDLGHARIHIGSKAAESAHQVGALAYTVGRDIVFGEGQYSASTVAGRKLLAHELTHVAQQGAVRFSPGMRLKVGPVRDELESQAESQAERGEAGAATSAASEPLLQRAPDDEPLKRAVCETTMSPPDAKPGECIYKFPESCPLYEEWIETFARLKTFKARTSTTPSTTGSNVFDVLGGEAAQREPKKPADKAAAPPSGSVDPAERFIDHPTDEWVKACLPPNLRATAYQLPSDCADIAVILRHVWLAAHKRTETFGKWTIGDKAGKAAAESVRTTINEVYTGNVAALVNPYSDPQGSPLRAFAALAPLLHAGDVLVWAHHDNGLDKPRTGGHTHTISRVERDDAGKIKNLKLLQGNQPIFGDQGKADDDKGDIAKKLGLKDTPGVRKRLGDLPGRRVEAAEMAIGDKMDTGVKVGKETQQVWLWGTETLLVAAGPPKAAARPGPQKKGDVRRLSDWIPAFGKATSSTLVGTWEAMLLEARAIVEGSGTLAEDEAHNVGKSAGNALWKMAKAAKDLGRESHFDRLQEMVAMVWAVRNSRLPLLSRKADTPQDDLTFKLFEVVGWIQKAFEEAARGAEDIELGKGVPKKGEVVRILLTGFDPFHSSARPVTPEPGRWNPAGAAVLALDGERTTVSAEGKQATVAVEGVILPVDFVAFKAGLVEKIVQPRLPELDAVLTASMGIGGAVQLERYVVGVHEGPSQPFEAVPAAGKGSLGPAIAEAPANLKTIESAAQPSKKENKAGAPEVKIGTGVTFRFAGGKVADQALEALHLTPLHKAEVPIGDEKALDTILKTMKRQAGGTGIAFDAGGKTFTATVLEGPGGAYLSNEVSYRVLRLLQQSGSSATSFHVHTPEAETISQDTSTAEGRKQQKQDMDEAKSLRSRVIDALRRIIRAVAGVVLKKRKK